jgi:HEAT repeat protein/beta-lactamase regulating signal transducer with metallopeptidase domain
MSFFSFVEISPAWLPFVEAIAKATLILGLAGVVALSLRGASAAARHLIWTSALLASLALPAASALLPEWQVAVLNVTAPAAPAAVMVDASSALAQNDHHAVPAPAISASLETRESTGLVTSLVNAGWTTWIALTWAVGSILILGRLLVGIAAVHNLARRTEIATTAPWLGLAQALAADLGIRRVEFRRGGASTMPMTWGVMRPVVLMPADADTWPDERLRIVLLHELAHVKRADCLTHLLAQTACAAYWINPLTWIAARRARAERERACDDLVLASGTPGPDYAAQLLEVARAMRVGRLSTFAASASLAMAHRSQLEGRLMAILDPSVPRSSMSRLRAAAAGTAALLLLAPLATIEPWVQVEAAVIPAQGVVPPPPPPAAAPAPIPTPAPAPAPAPAPLPSLRQSLPPLQASNAVQDAITGALETLPETISAAIDGALQATGTAKSATPDPKVVAALMEAMKDSDREVRESAMHALVRMRHPAMFEPLVLALKDSSADIRESAAFGLGQLRDKRAAEPLKAALKDSSASVREQAVFALGQLRDASAFDGLVLATRDESASVREQAVFALGQLRDPKAVDPLVVALRDASGSVREQAAFALGQLRAKTAVDALMAALKESDVDVREQAAFALGQIGDPRAVDALTAALKDSSAKVRQQVAFALGQLIR